VPSVPHSIFLAREDLAHVFADPPRNFALLVALSSEIELKRVNEKKKKEKSKTEQKRKAFFFLLTIYFIIILSF